MRIYCDSVVLIYYLEDFPGCWRAGRVNAPVEALTGVITDPAHQHPGKRSSGPAAIESGCDRFLTNDMRLRICTEHPCLRTPLSGSLHQSLALC